MTIEKEDNTLDFLERIPSKALITFSDGSSEVFNDFVLYSVAREKDPVDDDKLTICMETIIKLPEDLNCKELLALVYGISDTITKILSNGFENNHE